MRKYRLVAKKGEGTFSEVLKAQNIKDGKYHAIKCMKNRFDSIEQVNNLREIQALRRLSPHEHIINLQEVLYDQPTGRLALVFELMDANLYELIRGRKHYLNATLIKSYMYQLLRSLDHMHRKGIFHRDIKPENILIENTSELGRGLKLADFGSCRGIYSKQPYTEYISTRWYRAPECLLTDGYYGPEMDLWGAGCVFFEITSLYPLFPGTNEIDQVSRIHKILGTPTAAILSKLKAHGASHVSFDFPTQKGVGLAQLLPHAANDCVDLMIRMLRYNAPDRILARDALQHAYFKEIRDSEARQQQISSLIRNTPALTIPAGEQAQPHLQQIPQQYPSIHQPALQQSQQPPQQQQSSLQMPEIKGKRVSQGPGAGVPPEGLPAIGKAKQEQTALRLAKIENTTDQKSTLIVAVDLKTRPLPELPAASTIKPTLPVAVSNPAAGSILSSRSRPGKVLSTDGSVASSASMAGQASVDSQASLSSLPSAASTISNTSYMQSSMPLNSTAVVSTIRRQQSLPKKRLSIHRVGLSGQQQAAAPSVLGTIMKLPGQPTSSVNASTIVRAADPSLSSSITEKVVTNLPAMADPHALPGRKLGQVVGLTKIGQAGQKETGRQNAALYQLKDSGGVGTSKSTLLDKTGSTFISSYLRGRGLGKEKKPSSREKQDATGKKLMEARRAARRRAKGYREQHRSYGLAKPDYALSLGKAAGVAANGFSSQRLGSISSILQSKGYP